MDLLGFCSSAGRGPPHGEPPHGGGLVAPAAIAVHCDRRGGSDFSWVAAPTRDEIVMAPPGLAFSAPIGYFPRFVGSRAGRA
jgi:hypothetical protein